MLALFIKQLENPIKTLFVRSFVCLSILIFYFVFLALSSVTSTCMLGVTGQRWSETAVPLEAIKEDAIRTLKSDRGLIQAAPTTPQAEMGGSLKAVLAQPGQYLCLLATLSQINVGGGREGGEGRGGEGGEEGRQDGKPILPKLVDEMQILYFKL